MTQDQNTGGEELEFVPFNEMGFGKTELNEEINTPDFGGESEKEEKPEVGDSSLTKDNNTEEKVEPEVKENGSEEPSTTEGGKQLNSVYHQILKDIFGNKVSKITIEEDGADVEMEIDKVPLDAETFKELFAQARSSEKEELLKDKVDLTGMNERTRKLVEVSKAGGDVTELLQMQASYGNPVQNLDLQKAEDQKQAVFLLEKASGRNNDDTIARLIRSYEQDGVLQEKAEEAVNIINSELDLRFKKAAENAQEAAKQAKEELKTFGKNLKEAVSSQFQLTDTITNKLVEAAVKPNDKGRFPVDLLYAEARKDPAMTAKLALLLSDPKEYDKQVSRSERLDTSINDAAKLKLSKKSTGTGLVNTRQEEDEKVIGFESLKFND